MRKMFSFAKYRGIGLLELMLALAIIAIMLIMAVRYFQSASNNNTINIAVDECNALKAAVKSYTNANLSTGLMPTISQLVAGGYLPGSYGSGITTNPWGSSISAIPGTSGSAGGALQTTFSCVLTGVPTGLCTQINGRIQSTLLNSETSSCTTGEVDGDTFIVTYSM